MTETPKTITVNVKTTSGTKYSVVIAEDATIEQLKQELSPQCGLAPEEQRLIYSGHILRNEQTLKNLSTLWFRYVGDLG